MPQSSVIRMAQTKHEIEALLASVGMHPRHRFGQNFMIDQNLLRLVADAGRIEKGDLVIEVGPGTGTLTEELLARGARVIAVEIDRDLANLLRQRLAANENFQLIEGDALSSKHALNPQLDSIVRSAGSRPARLVANLPYNVASPLVVELLLAGVSLLAFTVQKEVAMRMNAAADSEDYGPLSIMVQMLARVEILRSFPPHAFWPAPKIESALVRLTRDDRLGGAANEFSRFVHQLFSSRRKTIRKALAQAGYAADDSLSARSIDPRARPETLNPHRLFDLFRTVAVRM